MPEGAAGAPDPVLPAPLPLPVQLAGSVANASSAMAHHDASALTRGGDHTNTSGRMAVRNLNRANAAELADGAAAAEAEVTKPPTLLLPPEDAGPLPLRPPDRFPRLPRLPYVLSSS